MRDLDGLKTVGVIEEDEKKGLLKLLLPIGWWGR